MKCQFSNRDNNIQYNKSNLCSLTVHIIEGDT